MIDLNQAIGSHDKYCDGYENPGASGNGYMVAVTLGTGTASLSLNNQGSSSLDGINAFDRAEVEDVFIGQINMITVSSFCGLNGAVLGYHFLKSKDLYSQHPLLEDNTVTTDLDSIQVYSAAPLVSAARTLFGTVGDKKYPLIPGAHVPCAEKSIKGIGPKRLYVGYAIGIPEDQEAAACLMMEDLGEIPLELMSDDEQNNFKKNVLINLAKSVLLVGKNQRVKYKETFVEIKDVLVSEGEIGCALVAAPYFTIARNAVPQEDANNLVSMNLEEWAQNF